MVTDLTSPHKPAESLCNLPVFAPLRTRISQALRSRPDPERLAALVTLDPAITAELLTAANSPAYGHALQIYRAIDALKILGWDETARIVNLAFDAQEKFQPEIQTLLRAHWRHSLACAVAASQLAPFLGIPEERAFTFGMLHDIGTWGLMGTSPDAYARAAGQGSGSCLEKLGVEQCMLGIDHCNAGSWLVNSWGLPAEFAEAAAMHHDPEIDVKQSVAAVVTMACRWADALGFSVGHSARVTVRDALRITPSAVLPRITASAPEIAQNCRARLLEYANEFDGEIAKLLIRL